MNSPDGGETLRQARRSLLAERNEHGHWEGCLSSSALSTATAVVALNLMGKEAHAREIDAGCDWLLRHSNEDGGWGDTVRSHSNLSTTLLCWSALTLARPESAAGVEAAERWITAAVGGTDPDTLVRRVTDCYGKDRTFAVPILMTCAICGRLGSPGEAWRRVLPLPFELAALPRSWFAALQLPVVSYALPALISIGYARNAHAPPFGLGRVRRWIWPKVSRLLEQIQPASGGFLEAAPLTSFVTMALASSGQAHHPVARRAVEFLRRGQRADGSWPIDTNLATWATTLAINALLARDPDPADWPASERDAVREWVLGQQFREVHPFTNAAPGGWAWTNLPGGVPDADDTPGALLALRRLCPAPAGNEPLQAAERGIVWLLDLQNRDGGIPTFCRGWGTLPFDRSSPDLTAHTLRAWLAWRDEVAGPLRQRLDRAGLRAVDYLKNTQEPCGSWVPLWFGNQDEPGQANRTYGTAKVLAALAEVQGWLPPATGLLPAALNWLLLGQLPDGGWGGGREGSGSSVEETALAMEALGSLAGHPGVARALHHASAFLGDRTAGGTRFSPAPIGLYFARLWYFERLYPVIWTVSALQAGAALPAE